MTSTLIIDSESLYKSDKYSLLNINIEIVANQRYNNVVPKKDYRKLLD